MMNNFDLFRLESRQMKNLYGGNVIDSGVPPTPDPGDAGDPKNPKNQTPTNPPIPDPTNPNGTP